MNCPFCNSNIPDDSKICPICSIDLSGKGFDGEPDEDFYKAFDFDLQLFDADGEFDVNGSVDTAKQQDISNSDANTADSDMTDVEAFFENFDFDGTDSPITYDIDSPAPANIADSDGDGLQGIFSVFDEFENNKESDGEMQEIFSNSDESEDSGNVSTATEMKILTDIDELESIKELDNGAQDIYSNSDKSDSISSPSDNTDILKDNSDDDDKLPDDIPSEITDFDEIAGQLFLMPHEKERKPINKKLIIKIAIAVLAVLIITVGGFFAMKMLGVFSSGQSVSGEYVLADKKAVYFADPTDGNKLYKIDYKHPEKGAVKLTDESVRYLSMMGGYIYYSAEKNDGMLKAVSTDGEKQKSELSEHSADYVICFGGDVYFSCPGEDNQIYRMTGGGTADIIENAKGTQLKAAKNNLFYNDNGTLYCISIAGKKEPVMIAENIDIYDTNGEDVIAQDNSGRVMYISNAVEANGKEGTDTGIASAFELKINKKGDKFYYTDKDGNLFEAGLNKDSVQIAQGTYDDLFVSSKAIAALDEKDETVYVKTNKDYQLDMPQIEAPSGREAPTGNGVNQAYAAVDNAGAYIYYLSYSDNSIKSITTDGTDSINKIADIPAAYITIHDGWVYYADYNEGGLLYRMKPDGTETARITVEAVSNVLIYGDWIYYIAANNDLGEYYIRRTACDGTVTETVVIGNIKYLTVVNGWIYYTTADKENTEISMYRIRTDGQCEQLVMEKVGQPICSYKERIYYTDANDHMYSCDLNGGDVRDLGIDALSFTVDDNAIYFSEKTAHNLCKASTDGNSNEVLASESSFGISVCGDSVVFIHYDQESTLFNVYCVNKDGTNLRKIG